MNCNSFHTFALFALVDHPVEKRPAVVAEGELLVAVGGETVVQMTAFLKRKTDQKLLQLRKKFTRKKQSSKNLKIFFKFSVQLAQLVANFSFSQL